MCKNEYYETWYAPWDSRKAIQIMRIFSQDLGVSLILSSNDVVAGWVPVCFERLTMLHYVNSHILANIGLGAEARMGYNIV